MSWVDVMRALLSRNISALDGGGFCSCAHVGQQRLHVRNALKTGTCMMEPHACPTISSSSDPWSLSAPLPGIVSFLYTP